MTLFDYPKRKTIILSSDLIRNIEKLKHNRSFSRTISELVEIGIKIKKLYPKFRVNQNERFLKVSDYFIPPFCDCGGMLSGILGTLLLECLNCKQRYSRTKVT
jgi:predicted CopG family antitoxin